MAENSTYPLYELSGQEFEQLCCRLLLADDANLSISHASSPPWLDAVGTRKSALGVQTIAIETKHRTTFQPEGVRNFLERMGKEDLKFEEYIFITSSPIPEIHRRIDKSNEAKALNAEVKILGLADVIALLDRHSPIAAEYFSNVRKRLSVRRAAATWGAVALTIAAGGLGNAFYTYFSGLIIEPKSQLSEQVAIVENSIRRLNDLEKSLTALKTELQQKSEDSARIAKEYEAAMKLKSLTAEQLEQVKKAVGSQSATDIFLNYFFGFLLGVAGSVFATIITDKWKQKQALKRSF